MSEGINKDKYLEYLKTIEGASVDQPFVNDKHTFIARHKSTRKWFAALMKLGDDDFVNIKCHPFEGDFLRNNFEGITSAYHMNKWHWISVHFNSDVPDDLIYKLTEDSFILTDKKSKANNIS